MPLPLTKRQKQVLTFISWWIGRKGYPPSLSQIGAATKIGTRNGVRCHLLAIERKGFLKRDAGVCRGMQLVGDPAAPMLRLVGHDEDDEDERPAC